MDIDRIIQDLLISNNSITVIGLGTFSMDYIPAEIYKVTNRVTSPSYNLVFDENFDDSDNLLIKTISGKYSITEDKARLEVENWVNKVRETFEQNVGYTIKDVGTLKKDSDKISFIPDTDSPLLADNYGFETTNIPLFELDGEVTRLAATGTEKYDKPLYSVNRERRALLGAIAICTVIILSILYQSGYLQPGIYKILELFSSENVGSDINAIKLKRDALQYNEMHKKAGDTINNLNAQSSTEKKILRYYLIAGSFKTMKSAEKLKEELAIKGFSPEVLVYGDSLFRVSLSSYTIRRKAVNEYIRLTSEENNYKLWFFSQLTAK